MEILGDVCSTVERELLSSRGTLERAKLEAGNELVKIFEAYNRQWGSGARHLAGGGRRL